MHEKTVFVAIDDASIASAAPTALLVGDESFVLLCACNDALSFISIECSALTILFI
jgi:hypothetical protein